MRCRRTRHARGETVDLAPWYLPYSLTCAAYDENVQSLHWLASPETPRLLMKGILSHAACPAPNTAALAAPRPPTIASPHANAAVSASAATAWTVGDRMLRLSCSVAEALPLELLRLDERLRFTGDETRLAWLLDRERLPLVSTALVETVRFLALLERPLLRYAV